MQRSQHTMSSSVNWQIFQIVVGKVAFSQQIETNSAIGMEKLPLIQNNLDTIPKEMTACVQSHLPYSHAGTGSSVF